MNWLTIILGFTATVAVVGLLAILTWLLYTGHLARVEREPCRAERDCTVRW